MVNIEEDHFRKMAVKAQLPEELVVRTMRETVTNFRDNWDRFKKELPMSPEVIATIEKHQSGLKI